RRERHAGGSEHAPAGLVAESSTSLVEYGDARSQAARSLVDADQFHGGSVPEALPRVIAGPDASQQCQQGALATAIGPEQRDTVACVDADRDVFEQPLHQEVLRFEQLAPRDAPVTRDATVTRAATVTRG